MACADFFSRHMMIDWRVGEEIFRGLLLCGDRAQNVGNWQWVAGCGLNARAYFRVSNPLSLSKTADPEAIYIKRWVPELRDVSSDDIFALSASTQVAGYPAPMLDFKQTRARYIETAKAHLAKSKANRTRKRCPKQSQQSPANGFMQDTLSTAILATKTLIVSEHSRLVCEVPPERRRIEEGTGMTKTEQNPEALPDSLHRLRMSSKRLQWLRMVAICIVPIVLYLALNSVMEKRWHTLKNDDFVSSIAFTADGKEVISAGVGLTIWDVTTRLPRAPSFPEQRSEFGGAHCHLLATRQN
jgi:hypothetical protein